MSAKDTIFLVGCSAEKKEGKHPASELYVSERFKLAKSLIREAKTDWAILSGRHGLISPTRPTTAYDFDLRQASAATKKEWSAGVVAAIMKQYSRPTRLVVLAEESYYADWLSEVMALGHTVFVPSRRATNARASDWLTVARRSSAKRQMLEATYDRLAPLLGKTETFLPFKDCKGGASWPSAGVYLFFDQRQSRLFHAPETKVVRFGTHGVSDGSISTLWQRLKAHKGDLNGLGNHRTSIFRLHVGTALMRREKISCPSWGSTERPSAEELAPEAKPRQFADGPDWDLSRSAMLIVFEKVAFEVLVPRLVGDVGNTGRSVGENVL